jgi:tetratricopeptide (TPR) repeat protein/tRNA A-37 threonylcarbamoyl transferase component Bud32
MADRSGQRLDKYQLIRLLGQGAFGQVYLGENVFRKTQVAVKVLQTQLTSEELHAFLNEARIFSLEHPNIVRVRDFGVERTTNTPFIVMDYAPNGTLRQRHPRGTQLPLATVVSYVKQVAAALQYAHEENLIHRDVKPENMLVGQNGEIVLSDFGVAVIAQSGRTSLENPQNLGMGGTPYYMAPEQFLGKPGRSSDQYSLGIVVYEWLCGERPFNGTLFELLGQHMQVPPAPLSGKVPGISPEVEQVVLRALEKEPQKRFAGVGEFAVALEEAYKKELALRQTPMIEGKTKEQWLAEGNAHCKVRRNKEAIAAYDRALELDPNYAAAYTNRGTAYRELKEYQKAIADYDHALQLDPNLAQAYNNRGIAYRELKEYQKALVDYGHALVLDPNYAFAYNNRGNAYRDPKEYQKAIADYDSAIALDPNNAAAYTNRGTAYRDLKEYQKAIADYDSAIALDPNYVDTYLDRGEAYRLLKEYRRAIDDHQHAISLAPNYAGTYHNRGLVYSDLKEYQKALADCDRAIALDPNNVNAYNDRGLAYFYLEEYQKALADCERAIALDPKYANAYYNRGTVYFDLKEYQKAIADFTRAIELNPRLAWAYGARGCAYYDLKDYQRAVQDFDYALQLDPSITRFRSEREDAYRKLGRKL